MLRSKWERGGSSKLSEWLRGAMGRGAWKKGQLELELEERVMHCLKSSLRMLMIRDITALRDRLVKEVLNNDYNLNGIPPAPPNV